MGACSPHRLDVKEMSWVRTVLTLGECCGTGNGSKTARAQGDYDSECPVEPRRFFSTTVSNMRARPMSAMSAGARDVASSRPALVGGHEVECDDLPAVGEVKPTAKRPMYPAAACRKPAYYATSLITVNGAGQLTSTGPDTPETR